MVANLVEVEGCMEFEDITALLPKGCIPKTGLRDEVTGNAIIDYATGLAGKISDAMSRFDEQSDEWHELNGLKNTFLAFRWAYPIKLKPITAVKCDRTQGLIGGPLFTSQEFPWPEKEGRYREPIAQFYLEEVGPLEREDLGEGLLQLWVGPGREDYLIRVIPSSVVSADAVSAWPIEIKDDYFEKSEFYAGWAAWPEQGKKVYNISCVDGKVLNWDTLVNFAADDLSFGERFGKNLEEDISSFTAIIPQDLPSTEPHFFGNFSLIQYDVSLVPRTLLALEGKPCFLWGDYGNAQIFYARKEDGGVDFSFSWSCH